MEMLEIDKKVNTIYIIICIVWFSIEFSTLWQMLQNSVQGQGYTV